MSQWTERVTGHPITKRLISLRSQLRKVEGLGELTSETSSATQRLKQVCSHSAAVLSSIDPELLPLTVVNNIDAHLQKIQGELTSYEGSKEAQHLITANSHADGVLTQLSNVALFYGSEELRGLRSSIISLRRSVGQYRRYVESEKAGLKGPISEAERRLGDLKIAISEEKTRVDSIAADLQKQFSEAQEKRRIEFADELKENSTRFNEVRSQMESDLEASGERLENEAQSLLETIDAKRQRAQELLFVIANTGMVGGYQQVANHERKVARVWQGIATGSFIGLIGFAVFTFAGTLSPEFAWPRFAARAFVAVTFGLLAAYAARQADRHEAVERQSRRTELALASLEPFLVSVPEEDQHALKKQLAVRFFGSETEADRSDDSQPTQGTVVDLLRLALESLSELSKQR